MVSQKTIEATKASLIGGGVVAHQVKAYPCGNSARSASLCSQQKANSVQTAAIKASHAGGKKTRKHKARKHKARKHKGRKPKSRKSQKHKARKHKTRKHKTRKHKGRKYKARKQKTRKHSRTRYGGANKTVTVPSFPGCSKSAGVNNSCTASKQGNATGLGAQVDATGDTGAFKPIVQPTIRGGSARKEWYNVFTSGPLKKMAGGRRSFRFHTEKAHVAGSRARDN